MDFPVHCQTRGQRFAHALWLFWDGAASSNDLARLIDAEFPVESSAQASEVPDLRDVIADRLRQLNPQLSGRNTIATELAEAIRAAGLIRG